MPEQQSMSKAMSPWALLRRADRCLCERLRPSRWGRLGVASSGGCVAPGRFTKCMPGSREEIADASVELLGSLGRQ